MLLVPLAVRVVAAVEIQIQLPVLVLLGKGIAGGLVEVPLSEAVAVVARGLLG
jgi:hypothetical protein